MKVVVAASAGFCSGVKNAMRTAVDAAEKHGGVYSLGPVIHNGQAVRLLALRGVRTLAEGDRPGRDKPILVRAHGIAPAERDSLLRQGHALVDATCVHVAANQRLAAEAAREGRGVIVAGDRGHPEVVALLGSAGDNAVAVSNAAEADRIAMTGPPFLLAQTTFEPEAFEEIAARLRKTRPDLVVKNTICGATRRRQDETRRLAGEVEALVVVGGRHSANTRRLAEIGESAGKPAFLVETAADVDPADFAGFATVGVTAGASTPGWITREVVDKLSALGRNKASDHIRRALRVLLASRVLTALSAAGLAFAAQAVAGTPLNPALAAAAGCYVFFAHIINRRIPYDRELRAFSGVDPFYNRNRGVLLVLAWTAAVVSLLLSARAGHALLFVVGILAALAHSRIVVETVREKTRIRHIPGSRTVLTAAGWTLTVAGPALADAWPGFPLRGLAAAGFVLFLQAGKILARDAREMENDHLIGVESLPVRIGGKNTARLIRTAFLLSSLTLLLLAAVSVAAGMEPWRWRLGLVLLACVPAIGAGGALKPGDPAAFQCVLEGMGIVAGAVALAMGAPS